MMKLVCSKPRILPKKKNKQKEITTPKAKLLAALLLSQLTVKLLLTVDTMFRTIILWSDSHIVLCWLQKSPESLIVFVGNRVRQIQLLTNDLTWQYIPSAKNRGDVISQGMSPSELPGCQFWWYGPSRFHGTQPCFEQPALPSENEIPELRKTVFVTALKSSRLPIFDRISRYTIIQRSMASMAFKTKSFP